MSKESYLWLADSILVLHVAFVGFVVLGLLLIFTGFFLNWAWVRNVWFRALHLLAIVIVVLQAWAGLICPLTTLEMWLREQAGVNTYQGSFIQHWLQSILYYQAPEWVFIVCYSAFGALILASWYFVRPGSQPR